VAKQLKEVVAPSRPKAGGAPSQPPLESAVAEAKAVEKAAEHHR